MDDEVRKGAHTLDRQLKEIVTESTPNRLYQQIKHFNITL